MSTPDYQSEWTTKGFAKFKLLLKARGAMIVSLAILIISGLSLVYQTAIVVSAMDKWTRLRAAEPNSDAVDEVLESLNNEEIMLIMPVGLTLISLAACFHSVKLEIIPKRCFYCGKWAHARHIRQTRDKLFHYHEECEVNKRQGKDSLSVH
jgi:hypothetical protein